MTAVLVAVAILLFGSAAWLLRLVNRQLIRVTTEMHLRPGMTPGKTRLVKGWRMYARRLRFEDLLTFSGDVKLPRRVYLGDSHNISVVLEKRSEPPQLRPGARFRWEGTETDKRLLLTIHCDYILEVELIAAGFAVEGQRCQQQLATPDRTSLVYRWNCYFPNSGSHTVAMVFREVSPPDADEVGTIPYPIMDEVGTIEHTIKVVRLDHLTHRQVWILGVLAAIGSGCLTVAEVLHGLGIW